MELTAQQLSALKADLAASEFSALPKTADNADAIAKAYNLNASPAYTVWKSSLPVKDVKNGVVWTEFIARSAGERDAFAFMLSNGTINPSDPNIRSGITDCFSGAGGLGTRTNLNTISKRLATRAEKLFASGGTGSNADPATMNAEGPLTIDNVQNAWNS